MKRTDTLAKGDVIKTAYGVDDNIITVVVDSVEDVGGYMNIKIKTHMPKSSCEIVMFRRGCETVEVVSEVNGNG